MRSTIRSGPSTVTRAGTPRIAEADAAEQRTSTAVCGRLRSASTASTVAVSILPIGGKHPAQRQDQPIGHAHDRIRHGIAEIRAHQLEQETQHERQRQQPEQGIDDDI